MSMLAAAVLNQQASFAPPAWAANFYDAWQAADGAGGQAHIAFYGDSVTMGYYATSPYYTNSYVAVAANTIAAVTGVTPGSGMMAIADTVAVPSAGEDRVTYGGTWVTNAVSGYFGQNRRGDPAATMTFTTTCESFRVHYVKASSTTVQSFSLSVDGGAATTVNPVITSGFDTGFADIVAGSLGSHTLTLTVGATASRFVFVIGVEGIASPTTGVKVSRIAKSGAKASDFIPSTVGSASLPSATSLAPDLAVLAFGLNDALQGRTTAAFKADMTTAIDAFKAAGSDVALIVPPPPNPTLIAAPTWASFATAIRELAVDEGVGLIDVTAEWVDYATSSARYFDNVHPNQTGHADMGSFVGGQILAAVNA